MGCPPVAWLLRVSLIVAIDFLFWFGYGAGKDAEGRMASLEQGLDLLEGLMGPILLGDLPDVRHAKVFEPKPGEVYSWSV